MDEEHLETRWTKDLLLFFRCICPWLVVLSEAPCLHVSGPSLGDLSDKKRGKFGWFSHSNETHGETLARDRISP